MTCTCKNPDGTFAITCNGTCNHKEFKENTVIHPYDLHNIEYMLSVFLEKLEVRIHRLEEISQKKYKEGFQEGFEMAKDIYE